VTKGTQRSFLELYLSGMKKGNILFWIFISVIWVSVSACNDNEPEPIELPEFPIEIDIEHFFGSQALELNSAYYLTENQDSFQLSKLIYHLNNIKFFNASGDLLYADDHYYLINLEEAGTSSFKFQNFDGVISSMSFDIGVKDSATNAEGLLNSKFNDPMFWGMINGYINMKVEGKSPSVGNEAVVLHVGGYLDPYKTARTVEVPFTSLAENKLNKNQIVLKMDLAEYFTGPNTIDLASTNLIHSPGIAAMNIADNWLNLFSFSRIK
jgi:hypothetical protein